VNSYYFGSMFGLRLGDGYLEFCFSGLGLLVLIVVLAQVGWLVGRWCGFVKSDSVKRDSKRGPRGGDFGRGE
jgi:hypothetical protein